VNTDTGYREGRVSGGPDPLTDPCASAGCRHHSTQHTWLPGAAKEWCEVCEGWCDVSW
jgi:hypothetical protein